MEATPPAAPRKWASPVGYLSSWKQFKANSARVPSKAQSLHWGSLSARLRLSKGFAAVRGSFYSFPPPSLFLLLFFNEHQIFIVVWRCFCLFQLLHSSQAHFYRPNLWTLILSTSASKKSQMKTIDNDISYFPSQLYFFLFNSYYYLISYIVVVYLVHCFSLLEYKLPESKEFCLFFIISSISRRIIGS